MLSTVLQLVRKSYQFESNSEADTLYSMLTDNKQSYCLRLRKQRSEENQQRNETS